HISDSLTSPGLALLKRGCIVRKIGRDGKSRPTTLWLDDDERSLHWNSRRHVIRPSTRTLPISDVVSIERSASHASVSLLLRSPPERSSTPQPPRSEAREELRFSAETSGAHAGEQFEQLVTCLSRLVWLQQASVSLQAAFPDVEPSVILAVLRVLSPQLSHSSARPPESSSTDEACEQLLSMLSDASHPDGVSSRECAVCLIAPVATRFECGHACCCHECATALLHVPYPTCPLCRSKISSVGTRLVDDEGLVSGERQPTYLPPSRSNPPHLSSRERGGVRSCLRQVRRGLYRHLSCRPRSWRLANSLALCLLLAALLYVSSELLPQITSSDDSLTQSPHPPTHTGMLRWVGGLLEDVILLLAAAIAVPCGSAFAFYSPGIRFRREAADELAHMLNNMCLPVSIFIHVLGMAALGLCLGQLLLLLNVKLLVILACNSVLGWFMMIRWARSQPRDFIVNGVQVSDHSLL
ncbi:MAG: hypothetical protein SGPRY_010567, partial [Prymnesium sp.]